MHVCTNFTVQFDMNSKRRDGTKEKIKYQGYFEEYQVQCKEKKYC